jgi:hypothetical protein
MLFALSACADSNAQADGTAQADRPASVESEAPSDSQSGEDGGSVPDADSNEGNGGSGAAGDEPEARSPIQVFFDVTPYNEERHRETEELIFACMKAEGFDYAVTDFNSLQSGSTGLPETSFEYGTVEFAETYGFAISTTRFSQATVGPDLLGHDASPATPPPDNVDSFDTLDEAGREASGIALFGKPLSGGEDFTQGGCLGEAQRALEEADPYIEFANEFAEDIAELNETIAQDSRLTELDDERSACVAATGFDPLAFQDELTAKVRAMGEAHLQRQWPPATTPRSGIERTARSYRNMRRSSWPKTPSECSTTRPS